MKTFNAILASGLARAAFGSAARMPGSSDVQIAAIAETATQNKRLRNDDAE